jgi:tRNA U34 5-carboxymethylaminomethyl modifying GTPase MnmE/TrmE
MPPAAIAIMRISGPEAFAAARALAGALPEPRRAAVRALRDPATALMLDRAIVVAFPGPDSATGEDIVEFHLHGGRAVIAAVSAVLAIQPGLQAAVAGEFTKRALMAGRIDLAEAEGLGDLLMAQTEGQRRSALALAEGAQALVLIRERTPVTAALIARMPDGLVLISRTKDPKLLIFQSSSFAILSTPRALEAKFEAAKGRARRGSMKNPLSVA